MTPVKQGRPYPEISERNSIKNEELNPKMRTRKSNSNNQRGHSEKEKGSN
jgi:hypothetical protein